MPIIFHRYEITKTCYNVPNHPFSALLSLCHKDSLDEPSTLIAIKNSYKIPTSTGISCHARMLRSLHKVINI